MHLQIYIKIMKIIKIIFNKIKKIYSSWKRKRMLKASIKHAENDKLIYD